MVIERSIIRKVDEFNNIAIYDERTVKIELTEAEIEEAYRIREREYLEEDIKNAIEQKKGSMQRMSEEKQKEIKTLKEWEESGKNWDDFCKPGELVDEDVYWYFLNILPPRNMGAGYLQVGGPYDSRLNPKTGKYMATYSTFVRVEDKVWKYCGNCFPGESVDIESEDKR